MANGTVVRVPLQYGWAVYEWRDGGMFFKHIEWF